MEGQSSPRDMAIVGGLFLLLAIVWSLPLVLHLADATPTVHPDSRLTTWILAWDAHALGSHPTGLFQAPYFYPQPDTLAYSDTSTALALFAAPIFWLSHNPYLAQNIVFILSVAFAGFAAYLLGRELTGSHHTGLLIGTAYAFAPNWAGFQLHIQILSSGWMPLTFFGLIRWWRTGRVRPLELASLSFVMATLTSWYQGVLLLIGLIVAVPILFVSSRPSRPLWAVAQGAGAIVAAALVLVPFAIPYQRVGYRFPEFQRSLPSLEAQSAKPAYYLGAPPPNLIWGSITARWSSARRPYGADRFPQSEQDLFPGATALILASLGLISGWRRRQDRNIVTMFTLIAAAGVIFALGAGPHGFRRFLPWTLLHEHLRSFEALRFPARANVLTTLGLAVLAGFGLGFITRRFPQRRLFVTAIVIAVVFAEGLAIPLSLGPAPRALPFYETLRHRPGGILEIPAGRSGSIYHDVDYMLYHTADWRPLANGFSGFTPPTYRSILRAARSLPAIDSISVLLQHGIRTLVVHTDLLERQRWLQLRTGLSRDPHFKIVGSDGPIVIYGMDEA